MTGPGAWRREGLVVDFDEAAGLGTVRAEDGDEFAFHCVAVAGGSRSIPVGVGVSFVVGPGLPGRWEATLLAQVPMSPLSPLAGLAPLA